MWTMVRHTAGQKAEGSRSAAEKGISRTEFRSVGAARGLDIKQMRGSKVGASKILAD